MRWSNTGRVKRENGPELKLRHNQHSHLHLINMFTSLHGAKEWKLNRCLMQYLKVYSCCKVCLLNCKCWTNGKIEVLSTDNCHLMRTTLIQRRHALEFVFGKSYWDCSISWSTWAVRASLLKLACLSFLKFPLCHSWLFVNALARSSSAVHHFMTI